MLFATDTFVGVLNANVASAVCTRHSRASVLGSLDALSLCFPMFCGHLTLKPFILNGLAAREREGSSVCLGFFIAFALCAGTFKEGTRTFIPDTVYVIPDTVYLLLDTLP